MSSGAMDNYKQQLDLPVSTAMVVMNSWDKLKQSKPDIGPLVGKLIFGKFFQVEPKGKELFPAFFIKGTDKPNNSNEDKQETTDGSSLVLFENESWAFHLHSQKVVETFDYAVTSLIDLDRSILVDLGEKHVSYLVKGKEDTNLPEYFAPLGEALLYALETGMQDYWDRTLQEAWTLVINFIATSMTEGMRRGMAKRGLARKEQDSTSDKPGTQQPNIITTVLAEEQSGTKASLDRTEASNDSGLPSTPESSFSSSTNDNEQEETPLTAKKWGQRFKQQARQLSCVFGSRNTPPQGL